MAASGSRPRIAVIVVSANSARWLRPCLTTVLEHAGDVDLDLVVVDSGCTDGTHALVEREFPDARVVRCENRGFAHANNQAPRTVDADWVLVPQSGHGSARGLAGRPRGRLRSRSSVGLVGVRQVTADGRLFLPTIRRFPNAVRSLFEALGWSGTPSARRGSASVSWTCPSTSWTWSATGRQAPSCSYAARRCRAPGSWTSGSFSTARRQTCACASSAGWQSGTCRR